MVAADIGPGNRLPFSSTTPPGSSVTSTSPCGKASSPRFAPRVTALPRHPGRRETLAAESVVAAPGVRYFQHQPEWSAPLPQGLCSHTCELVRFEDFEVPGVLIVGGRQSAYEWAALIGEHGAERVDIVHRP